MVHLLLSPQKNFLAEFRAGFSWPARRSEPADVWTFDHPSSLDFLSSFREQTIAVMQTQRRLADVELLRNGDARAAGSQQRRHFSAICRRRHMARPTTAALGRSYLTEQVRKFRARG
jgi:hypothetical protein